MQGMKLHVTTVTVDSLLYVFEIMNQHLFQLSTFFSIPAASHEKLEWLIIMSKI